MIETAGTCSVCGKRFVTHSTQPLVRRDVCGSCWGLNGRKPERMGSMAGETVVTTQEVAAETAREAEAANAALVQLRDLDVVTGEQIELASAVLLDVKGEYKRLDERQKAITAPLNAALKGVRDLFRPALSALEEAEVLLKAKIAQAQLAIAEANRRAMEQTQAALHAGDVRAASVASSAIVSTEAPKGLSYRDAWTYRVVDASKLPRDFLMPDVKKIAAHVKANGDKRPIPGVEVVKDVQVVARVGKP